MVLGLVILFVVIVRIHLLDLPLERDEGEYAYIGQLMLQGVAPYKMAYVVKLPGPALVYAVSMALFGQTPVGIHLGLLLANVAAIILVFLLTKRWFDETVAIIAAATYALMSLSWGTIGSAAHATQFIVPAAVGGILLLQSKRLAAFFWSGVLFGFAFLLKQPGLFFGIYGGLLVLAAELRARPIDWRRCCKRTAIYSLGALLPFVVLCLVVWRAGVFDRFWFWTFKVAGGGWVSTRQGWDDFVWYLHWLRESRQLIFWFLAAVLTPFLYWMRPVRPVRFPFLGFCTASMAAACLGWRFNPHYFVVALPAVGMVIGLGLVEARRLLQNSSAFLFASSCPMIAFCLICALWVFHERAYLFTGNRDQIVEKVYATQPFREAAAVAEYIKKNSAADDQVAVFGSEPEICFLAQRHSATGHLSTYILMDGRPYSHQMQEEMIREIRSATPVFIVYIDNILSWFPPAHADNTLLDDMQEYVKAKYVLVGAAVTGPGPGPPAYHWGADTRQFVARARPGSSFIFVFKLSSTR